MKIMKCLSVELSGSYTYKTYNVLLAVKLCIVLIDCIAAMLVELPIATEP